MQKESGAKASLLFSGLIPKLSNKLLSNLCRSSLFSSSLSRSLNSLSLLSYRSLFSNYLNSSSLSLLLTAFFVALVAAAHCSESNSYDKKHFLHNKNVFLSLKICYVFAFLRKTLQNYCFFCICANFFVILRTIFIKKEKL